ncbi:MAG: UvrD-helicase domain-containing protein, partial [Proteobacteria bacterium]|nr:UvrD-helicase domain-containing protein [Pseudomonadota bacterium]
VDFSEISMAAIEALGPEQSPTDLMLALDNRYSHILVDEYQDTSWTQVTLLRALTRGFEPNDGRSLFIVGDPMQSIYLFRDAEVGLFLDARLSGIGPLKLAPLTLRTNFRSDGHIVGWVNSVFRGALPETEAVMTGAVTYEESVAYRPTTEGAAVGVRLYAGRTYINDASEADDIIELLGHIEENETKAVLVRSRGHLDILVGRLKAEGIDFRAEKFDPLKERPVVQDLFALTRALYHPADRIAWLGLLRSRVCGLTLEDLHTLTVGDLKSPVLSLMHNSARLGQLSTEARTALARVSSCIDSALSLMRRVAPKALIEGLWCALGGPACYEGDDAMADAELYFKKIESISSGGELSSGSIEELDSMLDGLYATHNGRGENPVFLTTIHNAKGLEFDHVILPGLGREPRAGKKRILHWMERGDDLILAPIESRAGTGERGGEDESKLYKYLVGIEREKYRYEAARLFYVAVTRAKKRLYLFGHATNVDEEGEVSVESASLLGCIAHALAPEMVIDGTGGEGADTPVDSTASTIEETTAGTLLRLPSDWSAPDPIAAAGVAKELPESGAEASEQGERLKYDWATITASYVGTVVHGSFCTIATEGLESWTPERVEAEREQMKAELLSYGINRGSVTAVAKKCLGLVAAALSDEAGRWVLGEQNEAKVEWALSGVVDGEVAEVVIDRTFIDDKNVRWIIDYKTGRHEGSSIEGFLEDEKRRHGPQLKRYERVLRGYGEERAIKLALYYPALKRLVEL